MVDIDRMFRSELAVVAEQDRWALDALFDDDDDALWDAPLDVHTEPYTGDALGLFPAPNLRLGASPDPLVVDPQLTVHLPDITISSIPIPVFPHPHIDIPLSASPGSSSSIPFTLSPVDSLVHTDPSSEDMDSDDLELLCPSDSEFVPSPAGIDPASLSAPGIASPNADILALEPAIRPSRRMSRSLAKVPVPIPNLTKKSRGRKVPTSNGEPVYAASRDKTKKGVRSYTCHADGCRKCFVRGEHLKRHIRSIHTEEKPWICTYENCSRTFSRRDNLNQHLRIHRLQGDD